MRYTTPTTRAVVLYVFIVALVVIVFLLGGYSAIRVVDS
jgi:hypothetical protein